jgi:hypothetical protein
MELEEQTYFGFSPTKRQKNVAKAKIADSFYPSHKWDGNKYA